MSLSTNELLQQEMIWLNYYYLIYLSVDMKSFQERALQTHHEVAVRLIKEHICKIVYCLLIDLHLILVLQNSLWSFEQSSESIATRISQCKQDNVHNDYHRENKRLLWIRETLFDQKFESYQIDQRSK